MHTVFRIGDVRKIDKKSPLYEVDLKLTADDDQQLRRLTKTIAKEIGGDGCYTETIKLQIQNFDSGKLCIKYYKELLETIHILIQKSSNETKQKLLNYSRMIAQSTQELVQCAKQLKGADLIDPDDPTYIAENELFNAAQSIESAAKKLSILKPRRKPKEINENLNFDEQILEAAKSIMNAAGALINAATSAQKELASQGKVN
ncbi:unnamed protein product [Rotaria sp. Silwood1]|nr:unnamed protein product [Rotaria sp. Silwood1]